ncbi:MaoC family dehydratase [Haloarcula marina]|uniref:MaoC family dehydratase n=1 Tax=Haloarcula marina TaxID=2961574 RepID=UPI0020B7B5F0|nr:MaoC/PaaZ C-terminal domain-containing protein [Halomicroarcula marina]
MARKSFQDYDSLSEYLAETKTYEDFEVGQQFQTAGRSITHSDIRMFNGATDGSHPNHVNAEYAAEHPLIDGIVAHGVLIMGIVDGFVVDTISRDAGFGVNYGFNKVRFLNPVYVGDTISGTIEIVDASEQDDDWGILTLQIEISNQDDDLVLIAENLQLTAKESATFS